MEEFLKPMGISPNKLAVSIGVASQRVYEIIACKRAITLDRPPRLAAFLGTSREMWLGLQADYEYRLAEDQGLVDRIQAQVRPLEQANEKAQHA